MVHLLGGSTEQPDSAHEGYLGSTTINTEAQGLSPHCRHHR